MRLVGISAGTLLAALALAAAAAGCGTDNSSSSGPVTVRLGYFPNITHGTALVGVQKGMYAGELGSNKLETKTFNAGPAAVEALFSNALDMSYVGPNPAINAFVQSHGSAVRIVSGATSGGAALVVKKEINSAADLKGKKVASPQLGGTQDVALRFWLDSKGLKTTQEGGGDVSVVPQDNATTLQTFQSGAIQGAWVPEPWATRLVAEGGGKVLVDEKDLWPGGTFVTTVLLVRKQFLDQHPDAVRAVLRAHVKTNDFIARNPDEAQKAANDELLALTGKALKTSVLTASWKGLSFTNDPLSATMRDDIKHAEKVGLLKSTDIAGIYDLKLLNEVLAAAGQPAVKAS